MVCYGIFWSGQFLTLKPRIHVRILIYRTWAIIMASLIITSLYSNFTSLTGNVTFSFTFPKGRVLSKNCCYFRNHFASCESQLRWRRANQSNGLQPPGHKLGLGYRSCAIHSHGTFKDRILPRNVAGYGVVVRVREMGTVYEPALIVAALNMFNKPSSDIFWWLVRWVVIPTLIKLLVF